MRAGIATLVGLFLAVASAEIVVEDLIGAVVSVVPPTGTSEFPLALPDGFFNDTTINEFAIGAVAWERQTRRLGGLSILNATGAVAFRVMPKLKFYNVGSTTAVQSQRAAYLADAFPRGLLGNITRVFLLLSSDPAIYLNKNVQIGMTMTPPQPDGPCLYSAGIVADENRFRDPLTKRLRWNHLVGTLEPNTGLLEYTASQWKINAAKTFTVLSREKSGTTAAVITPVLEAGITLAADIRWPANASLFTPVDPPLVSWLVDQIQKTNSDCLCLNALTTETNVVVAIADEMDKRGLRPKGVSVPGPTLVRLANADGSYSRKYTDWTGQQQWDENLAGDMYCAVSYPGNLEPFECIPEQKLYSSKVFANFLRAEWPGLEVSHFGAPAITASGMTMLGHAIERCRTWPCSADETLTGFLLINQPSLFGTQTLKSNTRQQIKLPAASAVVGYGGALALYEPPGNAVTALRYPMRPQNELGDTVGWGLKWTFWLLFAAAPAGATGVPGLCDWAVTTQAKNAKVFRTLADRAPVLAFAALLQSVLICTTHMIGASSLEFPDLTSDQSEFIGYYGYAVAVALSVTFVCTYVTFRIMLYVASQELEDHNAAVRAGKVLTGDASSVRTQLTPAGVSVKKQHSFGVSAEYAVAEEKSTPVTRGMSMVEAHHTPVSRRCRCWKPSDTLITIASVPFSGSIMVSMFVIWNSVRADVTAKMGIGAIGVAFWTWAWSFVVLRVMFLRALNNKRDVPTALTAALMLPLAFYLWLCSASYTRSVSGRTALSDLEVEPDIYSLIAWLLLVVVIFVSIKTVERVSASTKSAIQSTLRSKDLEISGLHASIEIERAEAKATLQKQEAGAQLELKRHKTETLRQEMVLKSDLRAQELHTEHYKSILDDVMLLGWGVFSKCPLLSDAQPVDVIRIKPNELLGSPLALHFVAYESIAKYKTPEDILFFMAMQRYERDFGVKSQVQFVGWLEEQFLRDDQKSPLSLNHDARIAAMAKLTDGKCDKAAFEPLMFSVRAALGGNDIARVATKSGQVFSRLLATDRARKQALASSLENVQAQLKAQLDSIGGRSTLVNGTPTKGGMEVVVVGTAAAASDRLSVPSSSIHPFAVGAELASVADMASPPK